MSPKRGISGPTKKNYVMQKLKKPISCHTLSYNSQLAPVSPDSDWSLYRTLSTAHLSFCKYTKRIAQN